MKKLILFACMIVVSLTVAAQGNWEIPGDSKNNQPEKSEKQKTNEKKSPAIDAKYLEGAVPEVDGRVVWERDIKVAGKTATQLYDVLLAYCQEFVKTPQQTELSKIVAVNPTDKQLSLRLQEWLVFSSKFLSLDRTKFRYSLLISCKDGMCNVKIAGISYLYEEDRPGSMRVTAENWITDKNSLNKRKDGLQRGVKKFRMKTIDRVEEILQGIEDVLRK